MLRPRGFSGTELGDVEVIEYEGVLHAFYLRIPNHDLVGHAVSIDGIRWAERPPALRVGDPGSFDDDQIWTMGIIRRGAEFFMLYTALASEDEGRVQRTGLAISDDLETWTKRPGPAFEAAAPYRTDRDGAPWVAWRDPKPVLLDDGRVHVVVCARDPSAPTLGQAAVAHLVSDDLEAWKTLPPLLVDRRHFELECPQLFAFDGRYVLTAAVMEDRSQRYWVADSAAGPFLRPDDNRLAPRGHYAAKACPVGDEVLLFAFHDPGGIEAPSGRFVPAPLHLRQGPRGGIELERAAAWEGWIHEVTGVDVASLSPRFRAPAASCRGDTLASREGAELFFVEGQAEVALYLDLDVDAPLFGVALSVDDDGAGLFVEFDRGTSEVRVVAREASTDHGRPWFRQRVLSSGRYSANAETLRLEVLRAEGEVIVSVDGRVVVSTVSVDVGQPGIGILVDTGTARVLRLAAGRIAAP